MFWICKWQQFGAGFADGAVHEAFHEVEKVWLGWRYNRIRYQRKQACRSIAVGQNYERADHTPRDCWCAGDVIRFAAARSNQVWPLAFLRPGEFILGGAVLRDINFRIFNLHNEKIRIDAASTYKTILPIRSKFCNLLRGRRAVQWRR